MRRTGRRGRRYAAFAAGTAALAGCALGIAGNVAASLVPGELVAGNAAVVWTITAVLAVVTVVLAAAGPRADEPGSTNAGPATSVRLRDVAAENVVAHAQTGGTAVIAPGSTFHLAVPDPSPATSGRLMVGELPGAPPAFVERAAQDELRAVLRSDRVAVVTALTGARGVGKTQVAAAYARTRAAEGCPLVAWVSGASRDALLAGLSEVARELGVADEQGDSQVSAMNLRHALEVRTEEAVLVVDNALDADIVRPYLPAVGSAEIVITSTEQAFAPFGASISVGTFTPEEAREYLATRTGRPADLHADEVRDALGDLPLALAQAVTVLLLRNLTYEEYLHELRHSPVAKLLPRRPGDPYPRGTAEAILLALDAVEGADPTGWATAILDAMAFLSPSGVDRELARTFATAMHEASDGELDTALEQLVASSLLTWAEAGAQVVMHRLVSRVIRDRLRDSGHFVHRFRTVVRTLRSMEVTLEESWERRDALTPVVQQSVAGWEAAVEGGRLGALHGDDLIPAVDHGAWLVAYLAHVADLSRALVVGERLVDEALPLVGPDSLSLANARYCLGYALAAAGREAEAVTLFERVAEDLARLQGGATQDLIRVRTRLGDALRAAGRPADAIRVLERNLADQERLLGPETRDSVETRNSLGRAYQAVGRITDAVAVYERTLADVTRFAGTSHPLTLAARGHLAGAYADAGRFAEATALAEEDLAELEDRHGADHPDVLSARNNLALMHFEAGRVGVAAGLQERNLAECERLLGVSHPHTVSARIALVSIYHAVGRLTEAAKLAVVALAEAERVLGNLHPETLKARNDFASLCQASGLVAQAIPLFERNLTDAADVLGEDHPGAIAIGSNLGSAYWEAGRVADAVAVLEQMAERATRVLGPEHHDTLAARNQLALAYDDADRRDEALALFEQNLADAERLLGPDHLLTFAARNNVASTYQEHGRVAEAITMHERNLADRERVLGRAHPDTALSRRHLAEAYRLAGRASDADALEAETG